MFSFQKKFKQIPKDEYLERILCTVPGMTIPGNLYLMDKAIADLPEGTDILEIGSFCGQSAIIFHYLLKKHGKKARIICVDAYILKGWNDSQKQLTDSYLANVGGNEKMGRKDYLDFIQTSFEFHTRFFCPENTPLLYKITSDEFFGKISKGEIHEIENLKLGFCYIDGDHTKQPAINDMKNALQYSVKGAYILMDDSARNLNAGSAHAVNEIRKWKELEVVGENPNFLFRKV